MFNKEALRDIRKSRKLTQKQLAMKADLSFSMVSKLESGEQKKPSLDTLGKLADVLGISVDELLTNSKDNSWRIDGPIGARINNLRVKYGYTQKHLASLLGICPSTLTKYEIGQLEPNIAKINALAEIFKINVSELVDLNPVEHAIDIKSLNTSELLILLQTVSTELLFRKAELNG